MLKCGWHLRKPVAGRVLSVDIQNPAEETVQAVSSVLLQGGVVLYPSDTVYGLLADSRSESALNRITALKDYNSPRPFIVLVGSILDAMEKTTSVSCRDYMEKYWPGPVTLLLPGVEGKIALRWPADPFSNAVLAASEVSPVTTSANLKGGVNPCAVDEIPDSIIQGVDLVIDGGPLQGREPSMILDLTGEEPVRIR